MMKTEGSKPQTITNVTLSSTDAADTATVNFFGKQVQTSAPKPQATSKVEKNEQTMKLLEKYRVTLKDRIKFFFSQCRSKSFRSAFKQARVMGWEKKVQVRLNQLKDMYTNANCELLQTMVDQAVSISDKTIKDGDTFQLLLLSQDLREALLDKLDHEGTYSDVTPQQGFTMQAYADLIRKQQVILNTYRRVFDEAHKLCSLLGVTPMQTQRYLNSLAI
ncbi:hypothetical protein [Parendozoicomonas haliclonae]|uniref:Uncharacterized protein n=1 Tax=Parendozoicomonas haliclonae TaxID=1960125 RepID=A0A1X7ANA9_9GAMM|nr:hypothetical protein [Parendozoicomonas haliclonae]SMA49575.1 hypothetical protein EHSB41UT_03361 [Parendozoicomonas haliclonae]